MFKFLEHKKNGTWVNYNTPRKLDQKIAANKIE